VKYTKEELENILMNDFLLNPKAFSPGRTNDDMVDSMLICFILEREWTELFAKFVDNYTIKQGKYEYLCHALPGDKYIVGSDACPPLDIDTERILEHYERVKKWIEGNVKYQEYIFKDKPEMINWKPGNTNLMDWSINY